VHNIPLDDSPHPSICYHPQWSLHCSHRVLYNIPINDSPHPSICYHPQCLRTAQCPYRVRVQYMYSSRRFLASIYLVPSTVVSALLIQYRVQYTTRQFPPIHLSVTIHNGVCTAHTEYNIPLDDSPHPSFCYHLQWCPHSEYI